MGRLAADHGQGDIVARLWEVLSAQGHAVFQVIGLFF